ncbi:hypothetical protein JXX30_11915 [Rhodococcus erythropolis]|uniref:terminase small subunit n=1 Tax=Rhodococcus TaxID=1827 RepID=UPI001981BBAB|nr:hypothetical protein JXX30_11915 [Rhodococcus erythropolis]
MKLSQFPQGGVTNCVICHKLVSYGGTNPSRRKNKGGRPLKFKSVEELSQKIGAYFGNCDSHLSTRSIFVKRVDGTQYVEQEQYFTDREPYTVNGLAYALETTRDVLNDYESGNARPQS